MPEDDGTNEETREKLLEQNEEIEKSNELFNKLRNFVKLETPVPEAEEDAEAEKPAPLEELGLVRIMNYREPVNPDLSGDAAAALNVSGLSKDHHPSRASNAIIPDDKDSNKHDTISETESQKNQRAIDGFEIEKLSQKVLMIKPTHEAYEGQMMIQHNEAVFMVRRQILERAKNFWKEAKDVSSNTVLGMTQLKQVKLDDAFEKSCIAKLGYQLGEQYEDQNMRVTFKTFLKADDPRLEE